MLKIAAVIINYNSANYTIECIKSILEKTPNDFSYKLYVVDNNSEYNDYKKLSNYLTTLNSAKISLLRNKINKGFGGGNMFGVQFTEPSEYFAFINNDTLFINDCFSEMYFYAKKNNDVGIIGGQSFNEKYKEIISFDHYAGTIRQIFGRRFLEIINPKKYPKRKKEYQTPIEVNTVSGSFMLIDRNAFNSIGGFDENLFLYYEETDICLRLKKINKTCALLPSAKYLHYHGASTEKSDRIKKELKISLVYLVQKHSGLISKKVLLTYLIILSLFKAIIKPRNWPFLKLYLQGAPLSKSLKTQQKISDF